MIIDDRKSLVAFSVGVAATALAMSEFGYGVAIAGVILLVAFRDPLNRLTYGVGLDWTRFKLSKVKGLHFDMDARMAHSLLVGREGVR